MRHLSKTNKQTKIKPCCNFEEFPCLSGLGEHLFSVSVCLPSSGTEEHPLSSVPRGSEQRRNSYQGHCLRAVYTAATRQLLLPVQAAEKLSFPSRKARWTVSLAKNMNVTFARCFYSLAFVRGEVGAYNTCHGCFLPAVSRLPEAFLCAQKNRLFLS